MFRKQCTHLEKTDKFADKQTDKQTITFAPQGLKTETFRNQCTLLDKQVRFQTVKLKD